VRLPLSSFQVSSFQAPLPGGIASLPGIVLYRIAEPNIARELERKCQALRCPSLSLLKLAATGVAVEPNASYGEMISLHLKARSRTGFRIALAVSAFLLVLMYIVARSASSEARLLSGSGRRGFCNTERAGQGGARGSALFGGTSALIMP
jgi:hypothetical protein